MMRLEALGMAKLGLRFDEILSSPLQRAVETALIIADAVGTREAVSIEPGLQPGCVLSGLVPVLERRAGNSSLLLVGHQPDMGRLASELIRSDTPVPFQKGGFCCIEVVSWTMLPDAQATMLAYLLPPHVLVALGR